MILVMSLLKVAEQSFASNWEQLLLLLQQVPMLLNDDTDLGAAADEDAKFIPEMCVNCASTGHDDLTFYAD